MKTLFRYLLRLVAAGLLLAGFGFLYLKTYSSEGSQRETTAALMRELRQIDANWNAEVGRSKSGVSKDYDAITVPEGTALRLIDRVDEQRLGRFDDRLSESQKVLRATIVRKSDLVDRYKRESAILRNSLRYIPAATAELKARLREATEAAPQKRAQLDAIAAAAEQILQAATRLEASTDLAEAQRVDSAVARLAVNRAEYPPAILDAFDVFAKHATQIAAQKGRETETLEALAHVSLAEYVDAFDKEARRAFDRVEAQNDIWRTRFYVCCGLLAALLVFLLAASRRRSGTGEAPVPGGGSHTPALAQARA
jgi:two-component system, NtrC family, sensor kinase